MSCHIHWQEFNDQQWNEKLKNVPKSTITQSAAYGKANCKVENIKLRRGIIHIDGKEAGLIQIFEASLFFKAIHGVIMDRAPLWYDGFGGIYNIKMLLDVLNQEFPQRFGRKRRFLPEIDNSPTAAAVMKQCGWVKKEEAKPYKTLWWDLELSDEERRQVIHNSWLGSLKKAEASELEITWDVEQRTYSFFKQQYLADKQNKAYSGLSPKLLDNLALFSTKDAPMIIGNASHNNEIIASVLFYVHGRSATYQIGWTSAQGREFCAHHLLLWRSRDILKSYGVIDLDLGGINEENEGLSKFKKNTGAQPTTLLGHYF